MIPQANKRPLKPYPCSTVAQPRDGGATGVGEAGVGEAGLGEAGVGEAGVGEAGALEAVRRGACSVFNFAFSPGEVDGPTVVFDAPTFGGFSAFFDAALGA